MLQNAMGAEAWIQEKNLFSNPRVDKKSNEQQCAQCESRSCLLTSLEVFGSLLWILVWAIRMLNYNSLQVIFPEKKKSLFGITKNCNLGLQPQQTMCKSPRKNGRKLI